MKKSKYVVRVTVTVIDLGSERVTKKAIREFVQGALDSCGGQKISANAGLVDEQ